MKEKELNREERNKTVMETGALVMAEFYADWCQRSGTYRSDQGAGRK